MESKYIIELTGWNIFFIGAGLNILSILAFLLKKKMQNNYENIFKKHLIEIQDLKDQKIILMDKIIKHESTIGSFREMLKQAKKRKQNN